MAVLSLDMCTHTHTHTFYRLPLCSVSDKGNMYLHCWTHYQWTTEQSDVGYSMSTKDNMQKAPPTTCPYPESA
jgi:hypothetical protein